MASRIKENPKAFYTYIKSKRVARERVGPLKDRGGNLCAEPEEMGKVLNEYFVSPKRRTWWMMSLGKGV